MKPPAPAICPPVQFFSPKPASSTTIVMQSPPLNAQQASSPPFPSPRPRNAPPTSTLFATRIRALFKMDFAEAQYISELRSGPAGHFSYRRVAWEMFLKLQRQYPALARNIRATDFDQPIDIFQR